MSHVLDVLITVDTEIGEPLSPDWQSSCLAAEWRRDIDGATSGGDYGLPFQMQCLEAHGLRATFFVEALFALATGLAPLRRLVHGIDGRGHDVQLHLHPEWLMRMPNPVMPPRARLLSDFPLSEQTELIRLAAAALRDAGARQLKAFRAGNYGAGLSTLAALEANGVPFDSSLCLANLGITCSVRTPSPLMQPDYVSGVLEFPVGCFQDWPGHYRPLQVCACSSSELEWALDEAWRRGWRYLVIVTHSFELVHRPRHVDGLCRPNALVIARFERLCRFLGANRSRFRTSTFSDIDADTVRLSSDQSPLTSRLTRTVCRYVEQFQGGRA